MGGRYRLLDESAGRANHGIRCMPLRRARRPDLSPRDVRDGPSAVALSTASSAPLSSPPRLEPRELDDCFALVPRPRRCSRTHRARGLSRPERTCRDRGRQRTIQPVRRVRGEVVTAGD
jgi:hypothetical protein